MAGVVGVTGEDGECPIDLFGEDDASKLVWKSHAAQREEEIGALASGGGPAVRGAYGEDKLLRAVIAEIAETFGELVGGVLLASTVEEHGVSRNTAGLAIKPFQQRRLRLEELGGTGEIAGSSFDIIGEQAVGGLRFGSCSAGGDSCEEDFHQGERIVFYFRIPRRTYSTFLVWDSNDRICNGTE